MTAYFHTALFALATLAFVLPRAAHAVPLYPPKVARIDCAAAARIALPGARIDSVRAIAAADTGRAAGRKAHCRVAATVDVETHLVALLPDDWNERFLMGGGGGYVGSVDNQFASSVRAGYATVGTDAGHTANGLTAGWALRNPARVEQFAHLAVHRVAEVTKALITAYYGRAPQRSYFVGCSNGGRQGLMEAQRYPEDFDGIVAIAPAYDFLSITTSFIRTLQAQYPTGDFAAPVVTPAVLKLLASRVMAACDGRDGVRDETIEDPEACDFSLASLPACPSAEPGDGCVTEAQRAVLRTVTTETRAGGVRYPGFPFGNEADEDGWPAWITGPLPDIAMVTGQGAPTVQGAFGTEFFKYLVYGDSAWRYVGADLSRAARDGAGVGALLGATNPDLSRFRARGGKLILAHGWSDPALNARATIEYFNAVQQRTTGAADFTRLFMMPGVLHCAGGSGCDEVDWAAAIRAWVEQDEAPSRILAGKRVNGQVVRTRPLCAYPMKARYSGQGSTDAAASFTCAR